MSQNLATTQPWIAPAPTPEAPQSDRSQLRAVTVLPGATRSRSGAPKLVFALISLFAVTVVVVIQLLLSVAISQGAYQVSALQGESKQLGWERQTVATEVAAISSPQYIALNAEKLGMTMGGTPAYIKLSTGAIVGIPSEAGAQGSVVQASPSSIGNSLMSALTGATIAGSTDTDAPTTVTPTGPVSLDAGLPSPQTH